MTSVVIGTAGHIDHGKSALVLALTGTDPDRLKEEKTRGITIDLGFAHYDVQGVTYAFVDVPGHERFVKNMLAGASGIDAVLLVVAADESVMPQTREHFDICRLLQVRGGVIALTKADLADPEMIDLARLEVRELASGSFLEHAPIIPVSAKTGEGLDALRAALVDLAAAGPTREAVGPARLPIDRVFIVKGFGTVVTGTLVSGRIAVDAELESQPAGQAVKVRGLQVHGRKRADAVAGERVAVNLGGVDMADLARGDTLATPGGFLPTRRFDAVVELLSSARPLRHGARIRFHHGTSEVMGRVSLAAVNAGLRTPSELSPGRRAPARIRLEAPAVLTRGDRFIIRGYSPSETIAGGHVLDPEPTRGGIRTASAASRFGRLDPGGGGETHGSLLDAAGLMIEERRGAGLKTSTLIPRLGVPQERREELVRDLEQKGHAALIGDVLVAPRILEDGTRRLIDELEAYHRAQPLSEGVPREEIRARLFRRTVPAVFERVIADLVKERRITARERLALASHRVSLSGAEAEARDAIEKLLRATALKPPDVSGLPAATGLRTDLVNRIVELLIRQKVAVRVDTLVFHGEVLQNLKSEIAAMKVEGVERIEVATFKERYGVSRKFAIPLLEYLDRERVTRRVGETRVLL